MIVLITGGAKNGKSSLAQEIALALAHGGSRYYIATMIPSDGEDLERIRLHRLDRAGMGFQTIECGRNILSCLDQADPHGSFLLDSTTALLLNELFPDPSGCHMDVDSAQRCGDDLVILAQRVENIVIVSDGIYSDAQRYDEVTETYRRCLAQIDRKLAAVADTVLEVSCGHILVHKGVNPL